MPVTADARKCGLNESRLSRHLVPHGLCVSRELESGVILQHGTQVSQMVAYLPDTPGHVSIHKQKICPGEFYVGYHSYSSGDFLSLLFSSFLPLYLVVTTFGPSWGKGSTVREHSNKECYVLSIMWLQSLTVARVDIVVLCLIMEQSGQRWTCPEFCRSTPGKMKQVWLCGIYQVISKAQHCLSEQDVWAQVAEDSAWRVYIQSLTCFLDTA